jgi:hypothetical protein
VIHIKVLCMSQPSYISFFAKSVRLFAISTGSDRCPQIWNGIILSLGFGQIPYPGGRNGSHCGQHFLLHRGQDLLLLEDH